MAYKVFQNGYQLPASDLNNYLMNQSVMVFADSSARSAAITSPVEGMLSYLESTNSYEGYNGSAWTDINDNTGAIAKSVLTTAGDLIVASGASTPARLGIGTDGQILTSNGTTATWATPGSSGGLALLSTTILSGASTTVSSINQTYKSLYVTVEGINRSNNDELLIGPNGSYSLVWQTATATATTALQNTTASYMAVCAGYAMKSADTANSFAFVIDLYASSTATKPFSAWGGFTGTTVDIATTTAGFINTSSAITSLLFSTNGGTFSAGTVKIYGVN